MKLAPTCFIGVSVYRHIFHSGAEVAYLVGGLVKLLGIERGTNAESDTGAEEDVVGDGSNTAVVNLAL